ncbi:MAG: glycosyltransferase family 2 protein [Colwellia sp.]
MTANQLKQHSNYGFIVPNYNHPVEIESTINALSEFQLPIILVDDGSDQHTKEVLEDIAQKQSNITLIRHNENQGKGSAVQTGLKRAIEENWSHAIQIDADGQHNLNDIELFIETSKQSPSALISGQPIYDENIPKGRYYGRFITHFWVYIETLSTDIKDSMCGFRVYPLLQYKQLTEQMRLGNKMDFDTEVMVKLYWQGVEVIFIPTKVNYPESGISHFQMFNDNLLISWMHTKLFFGMIIRIPKILLNKFKMKKGVPHNGS